MAHRQPHRQTWSLSQDANKSSGTCSVCHAVRHNHLKNGTFHRHKSRNNPCPGSDKLPLFIQPGSSALTVSLASTSLPPLIPSSQVNCLSSASIASSLSTSQVNSPVFAHPVPSGGLIKHIPKSARSACATQLATQLNNIVHHPDALDEWRTLFNFGVKVLRKPARTGKRHNLASLIKRRITAGEEGVNEDLSVRNHSFLNPRNSDEFLAAAVSSKVEDGN